MIYILLLAPISIPAHCLVRHDSIPRGGHIVSLKSLPRIQSIGRNETIQLPISTAYGGFHIHLSPHNELFDVGASSTNFFKGYVIGFENQSTARFHVVGQHIEGIFSVPENGKDKFFFVDGVENRLGQVKELVIYDQLSHHQNTHCGCKGTMSNFSSIVPSRRLRRRQAVGKICRVAVIADASFSSQYGGKARDYMLQTMNTVLGIYERTFRLRLEIKQIQDSGKVNYAGGSERALSSFAADVRRGAFGFKSQDFCVVHMFVSQSDWGSTAGIANVGTVCRADNVGMSTDKIGNRLQSGQLLAITVAHEIGHNVGAEHSPDSKSIMAATVSDGATQFSSGSIQQISGKLGAGCLSPSGGGGSSAQPRPQPDFPETNRPKGPNRLQTPGSGTPKQRPNGPTKPTPNVPKNRPQTPNKSVPNIPRNPPRRPAAPNRPQNVGRPSGNNPNLLIPIPNIRTP
ncbi:hypothetical protein BKA69DRAFT_257457 [Paraphysoderma sedebokerense]|nr:hypothetical protein BKA69DRAFT_257457 [Paraphysoderma sedebokerense]